MASSGKQEVTIPHYYSSIMQYNLATESLSFLFNLQNISNPCDNETIKNCKRWAIFFSFIVKRIKLV